MRAFSGNIAWTGKNRCLRHVCFPRTGRAAFCPPTTATSTHDHPHPYCLVHTLLSCRLPYTATAAKGVSRAIAALRPPACVRAKPHLKGMSKRTRRNFALFESGSDDAREGIAITVHFSVVPKPMALKIVIYIRIYNMF